MAFTQLNQLAIAFKKLAGKTHTNASFGAANESIGSSVQLGSSTLFGDVIPSSPTTTLWSITGAVEKVRFELSSIATSQYEAEEGGLSGTTIDDSGDGAPTLGAFSNGIHAYALKLSGSYETDSSNPSAGTSPFTNGYHLTGSNGALQIIPDSFGSDYIAAVYESDGTSLIPPLNEVNYYLDPYAGILFVQDYDSGTVPTFVDAFIYIGDFVDDKIASVSSSIENLSQFQIATGSISASLDVGSSIFSVTSGSDTFLSINNDGTVSVQNDLNVDGDLIINGTASFVNTENLLVKDKFILLNSGSVNPDVGGLVIDEGGLNGSALVFSGSRWGFTSSFDSSGSNDVTPDAYISSVVIGSSLARYEENGNIRIDGSDIYIYSD